jgi:hypothetical protein
MFVSMNAQESVGDIIKARNYTAIEKLLDEEIDLCVMDDTQINTRDEAMDRIKRFLDKNTISKIESLHKGTSDGSGSKYNVFKLHTENGLIRAFIYFESGDNKQRIKELRFDKF